jgi:short-subunit dehydrogenase
MSKFINENSYILVLGASSGIGREISKILVKKFSAKVFGVARSVEKLDSLKRELMGSFLYLATDLSVDKSYQKLQEYFIKNNLKFDGVINLVGMLPKFEKFSFSTESVRKVFDVNFFSMVNALSNFTPLIKNSKKPFFINVSSSSALCPFSGVSSYSASKSSIVNFTECVARENKDIRLLTVLPGFTKSNVMRNQQASEKELKLINKISSDTTKVANKILKKLNGKKTRVIIGFDAHFMNFLYKFFPSKAPNVIRWFLKKSKIEMFKDI